MGSKKEQIGRTCPFCGAMVTFDEYFCRACHKRLPDQDKLDAPSNRKPETYVVDLRKIPISAGLALAGVGLAQFYNGDTFRGIGFFCAFLLVSFGGIGGSQYHTVLYFGIWIAATCEGVFSAWRINRYRRPYGGRSFLLWAEIGVLSLVVLLHLATGIPDMAYLGKFLPVVNLWMMR
jgi:TM2 domain-containing membrane protein YozV